MYSIPLWDIALITVTWIRSLNYLIWIKKTRTAIAKTALFFILICTQPIFVNAHFKNFRLHKYISFKIWCYPCRKIICISSWLQDCLYAKLTIKIACISSWPWIMFVFQADNKDCLYIKLVIMIVCISSFFNMFYSE